MILWWQKTNSAVPIALNQLFCCGSRQQLHTIPALRVDRKNWRLGVAQASSSVQEEEKTSNGVDLQAAVKGMLVMRDFIFNSHKVKTRTNLWEVLATWQCQAWWAVSYME